MEGEVIGGRAAYQMNKLEKDRRKIYICYLAVLKQRPRQGIATQMIGALKRFATQRDVYVIVVQAGLLIARPSHSTARSAPRKRHTISISPSRRHSCGRHDSVSGHSRHKIRPLMSEERQC
jgi:Acetyltransferase (GNAT) family